MLLRTLAALCGLFLLCVGCGLTSAPMHVGGPMNLALNPFCVPLVALGVAGVVLVPAGAGLSRGHSQRSSRSARRE